MIQPNYSLGAVCLAPRRIPNQPRICSDTRLASIGVVIDTSGPNRYKGIAIRRDPTKKEGDGVTVIEWRAEMITDGTCRVRNPHDTNRRDDWFSANKLIHDNICAGISDAVTRTHLGERHWLLEEPPATPPPAAQAEAIMVAPVAVATPEPAQPTEAPSPQLPVATASTPASEAPARPARAKVKKSTAPNPAPSQEPDFSQHIKALGGLQKFLKLPRKKSRQ